VNKKSNCNSDVKITANAPNGYATMAYQVWGAILECCQKYKSKLINTVKLKDCFVDDTE